jgi:hypothetical protein
MVRQLFIFVKLKVLRRFTLKLYEFVELFLKESRENSPLPIGLYISQFCTFFKNPQTATQ